LIKPTNDFVLKNENFNSGENLTFDFDQKHEMVTKIATPANKRYVQ
jgi:hypothetical protein